MSATILTGSEASRSARVSPQAHLEFAGLDILRLVACLSVLFYHYTFRGAARDGMTSFSIPSFQGTSKYGFFGVDLFFIISGFVIAYSANGRSAFHFLVSRVVRLYPAFIVCMPISFLVAYLFGAPEIKVTPAQLLANIPIVSPVFHESFVDGVYWSIVCEIIFYSWILLLIPLGALGRTMPLIVLLWLAVSLLNEAWLHSGAVTWVLITKYSGFFAIGVMFYHGRVHGWRRLSGVAILAAITLASLQLADDIRYHNTYYTGTHFDLWIALLLCWCTVACVWAIVTFERCGRRSSLVLLVGGITYPLYLLHQNLGYIAFNRLGGTLADGPLLMLVGAAVIVLAWAIWRYVERPLQRRLKALLLSKPRVRLPLAASAETA